MPSGQTVPMPRRLKRNPASRTWREDVPPEDTAPPEVDRPPLPDPLEWGVTAGEARALLERQMCPVCGEGPWKSPLNHVARKHGIGRHVMRDVCLLSMTDKVTDESVRDAWVANGRDKAATLRANAEAMRGTEGRAQRVTKASRASRDNPWIVKWMDEHPDHAAQVRAGFRERVTTPDALEKRRAAMQQVRAERAPMSPEAISAFKERMTSAEVVEKRAARLAENRTDACSVDGCKRGHAAKGYCQFHWRKARQYGDPNGQGRVGKPPRLSPDEKQQARDLCASGMSQRKVAEMLGVTQSIISRAVRAK